MVLPGLHALPWLVGAALAAPTPTLSANGPLEGPHPLALVIARACPDGQAAYADWFGTPIG